MFQIRFNWTIYSFDTFQETFLEKLHISKSGLFKIIIGGGIRSELV